MDRPACCSSDFSSSLRFKHAALGLRFRSATDIQKIITKKRPTIKKNKIKTLNHALHLKSKSKFLRAPKLDRNISQSCLPYSMADSKTFPS